MSRREPKEDSTKGKSFMRPITYKGDALVQVWVDSRQLAMLSEWLDGRGMNTRHLSEVLKFTIGTIVDKLLEEGIVNQIEYTTDARALLEAKYRVVLNPSGRGEKNLLHNMILDERRKEEVGYGREDINKPVNERSVNDEANEWAAEYRRKHPDPDLEQEEPKQSMEEYMEVIRKRKEAIDNPVQAAQADTIVEDIVVENSEPVIIEDVVGDEVIRPMTDAEIRDAEVRIEDKDRELMTALDKM